MAQVVSVNISEKKGMRKHPVPYIDVRLRHGIVGDAHAGDWHRQISLLAVESVDAMRADCPVPLDSGVFAENINTAGIDQAPAGRDAPARRPGAAARDADRQGVPQRLRHPPHGRALRHADGRHLRRRRRGGADQSGR